MIEKKGLLTAPYVHRVLRVYAGASAQEKSPSPGAFFCFRSTGRAHSGLALRVCGRSG